MSTLEFKKYNRKYIIVESFDDTKLPADDEVLGEGVVIVYTPTGELSNAEKCKIGDGSTIFADLAWIGADEVNLQTKVVAPTTSTQNIVPDTDYDGLSMVTITPVNLQSKGVSPSASSQTIKPDTNYHGLSSVIVSPCTGTTNITSTYLYDVVGKQYAKVNDADLIASNIKSGVNILGITGTYSGEELPVLTNPASTSDVLEGKEYIDALGVKQTGTISSIPEVTLYCNKHPDIAGTLSLSAIAAAPAYIPWAGYALGLTTVSLSALEPDFKAENIAYGVEMFGIVGTTLTVANNGDLEVY